MLVASSPTKTTSTTTTLSDPTKITATAANNITTNLRSNEKAIQSPFWFGGAASCLATFVSHPFDLTKVRLQTLKLENTTAWSEFKLLSPARMFKTIWHISSTEGITTLYSGLSASLLRQGTYSTIRFGLYDQFKWSVAGDQSKYFAIIKWRLICVSVILMQKEKTNRTYSTSIIVLLHNGRCIRRRIWKSK